MDCVVLKVQPDAQDEGGQQDEREDDQTARRVLAKAYAPKSSPGASIDRSRPAARGNRPSLSGAPPQASATGSAGPEPSAPSGDGDMTTARHDPDFRDQLDV